MSSFTIQDIETVQSNYPEYQIELIEGDIVIMSPSGLESEEVGTEIARLLGNWVRPRKLGRVIGSSAGFILPNSDLRAPDASFIKAEKLKRTTENYAEVVPDLIFEVKSKNDSLKKLREKIEEFLSLGTNVGVLVDPRQRIIEVYRLEKETINLQDGDIFTVPEILPGWEFPVEEIWAPEFD
ncbi:MAG: Uma2 family endonuclease [Crocosphaera sp.]